LYAETFAIRNDFLEVQVAALTSGISILSAPSWFLFTRDGTLFVPPPALANITSLTNESKANSDLSFQQDKKK
jgi:hypothetical protein